MTEQTEMPMAEQPADAVPPRSDRTVANKVRKMAAFLDARGDYESRIMVNATRNTLLKEFKPFERGGPLFVGKHRLVIGSIDAVQLPEPDDSAATVAAKAAGARSVFGKLIDLFSGR